MSNLNIVIPYKVTKCIAPVLPMHLWHTNLCATSNENWMKTQIFQDIATIRKLEKFKIIYENIHMPTLLTNAMGFSLAGPATVFFMAKLAKNARYYKIWSDHTGYVQFNSNRKPSSLASWDRSARWYTMTLKEKKEKDNSTISVVKEHGQEKKSLLVNHRKIARLKKQEENRKEQELIDLYEATKPMPMVPAPFYPIKGTWDYEKYFPNDATRSRLLEPGCPNPVAKPRKPRQKKSNEFCFKEYVPKPAINSGES